MKGKIAVVINKTLNADLPGMAWMSGYIAMLVGTGMTIVVQSSSVFTSAMTPLVGIGVITIDRMYPLTLGSNIGTTATGLLAALASSGNKLEPALRIALCHLFFNLSGILLFYPIPHMRQIPINLAKKLGNTTAKYRWFPFMYLFLMFFLLPVSTFSLSTAGPTVLFSVLGPLVGIAVVIAIVNILQSNKPKWLPKKLQTWDWLPLCMHSLKPIDGAITRLSSAINQCFPCCCKPRMDDDRQYTPVELKGSPDSSTKSTPANSAMSSRSTSMLYN